MTGAAALSVIVVNWNAGDLLSACLRSVLEATAEMATEVWIVDNASQDGSAERALRDYPEVRLLRNLENIGFARAANRALREADGEFVLLLNPDAELTQDALARMLGVLRGDPGVGIVGCQSVDEEGRVSPGYELGYPGRRHELLPATRDTDQEVAWVSGACLLARQAMVKAIGTLDEGFFMYCEDVDWCYRARQAGWRVVSVTGTRVRHRLGGSAAHVPTAETARRAAASRLRFYRKHYSPRRAGWLFVRMLVASLVGWGWRLLPSLLNERAREARRINAARLHSLLSRNRS